MRPLLLALLLAPLAAGAQATDSLRLGALMDAAARRDPRARQAALLASASALRVLDLRAARRPQLTLGGEATYQSEVPTFDLPIPGAEGPNAPRLRAQLTLDAEQVLWDGGRTAAQTAAERARLAEGEANVTATLYGLRLAVAEAFFAAWLAEERGVLLDLQLRDLEARRELVAAQAREGAALDADVAAVEADALRLGQQRDEAAADRQAALAVLEALVGASFSADAPLTLPDLTAADGAPAAPADDPTGAVTGRPELALFDARRDRVAAEAEVAARQSRPRVSAFGQGGIGRPGLAQFDDTLHPYGLVGLRARWPLLDWGAARRARASAALQQQVVDTEAEAFARGLLRDVEDERAAIRRLTAALTTDDAIIERRAEVERVARRQLEEGVLLAADYTRRLDELYAARTTRALHRAQLDQARTRLLVTLGLF